MNTLSKQDLFDLFESQTRNYYKKRGRFLFRPAIPNETILTIVSGKLESLATVKDDSVVVRNIELGSSAETYIITKTLFDKRYVTTDETHLIDNQQWTVATAKGEVEAFCYSGETIQFMAPWNENMICNSGDYIARPLDSNKFDIYRIDKDTFNMTYNLK